MLKQMRQCSRPLTLADIRRLEYLTGLTLPNEYKQCLLQFNGGKPEPAFAPVEGMPDNPVLHVQAFCGIDQAVESYELEWLRDVMRDRLGDEALPIACSDCGETFFLHTSGTRQCQVWLWDQAIAWGKDPSTVPVYKCADSFTEFLESLQPLPSSASE